MAAATGYRVSEFVALTPRCFIPHWGGEATVDLSADSTKNSKAAVQPISASLADVLREYLAGRAADESVWPGTWSERGADVIRADAEAAGGVTEITTKDGPQALDFDSLRGTFAMFLDGIDVSRKGASGADVVLGSAADDESAHRDKAARTV